MEISPAHDENRQPCKPPPLALPAENFSPQYRTPQSMPSCPHSEGTKTKFFDSFSIYEIFVITHQIASYSFRQRLVKANNNFTCK